MRLYPLLAAFIIFNTAFPQSTLKKDADVFFGRGSKYVTKLKYDSALLNYDKALSAYQFKGQWQHVASCYNRMAEIYYTTAKYDKALNAAQHCIKTIEQNHIEDQQEEAVANINIGNIHIITARHKDALVSFNRALQLFKQIYPEDDQHIADAYLYIANAYGSDGHLEQAMEYDKMALIILKRLYGDHHYLVGQGYSNLGANLYYEHKYAEAVKYYLMALDVFRATKGEKSTNVANTYRKLGNVYNDLNQYDKMIEVQLKGLAIYKELAPDDPHFISFYWNLGSAYAFKGEHKEAIKNYQLAVTTIQSFFGDKHPGLASSYTYFADYYKKINNYDMALSYYQKSLNANLPHFNNTDPYAHPVMENSFYPDGLFISLKGKAEMLNKIYTRDGELKSIKAAFVTYQLIDTLLDDVRQSHQEMTDKIFIGKDASFAYENAIEICIKLYAATNDKQYLESAFYFSEKSKVGALTNILADLSAKGNGLIPDKLLKFEQGLKDEVSRYQSTITYAAMQHSADSVAIDQNKKKLFNAGRKLDSLHERWDTDFPKYYNVKNSAKTITVKLIQDKISAQSAVLEYFEGIQKVYVFNITKNDFTINSFSRDSAYDKIIQEYRQHLLNGGSESSSPTENFKQYVISANALYKLLIPKTLEHKKEIKNLIIVPDGQLAYLPFEVLLTTDSKSQPGQYAQLDYLLKRYAINYDYSASLNFNSVAKPQTKAKFDYLLMAPTYDGLKSDSVSARVLGKFRSEIVPLKWSKREVESISQAVGGDCFLGGAATESRFKKSAKDYRVLHLAMHALVDDEDPMNSKFVFSHESDAAADDGFLYAFELYSMELNAQLVVLSACKTGYGQLAKGEGVMSLARAFSIGGVPSVVMSHWNVDDEATSKLMDFFYANLADGMSKGEALQKAKLRYLSDADPSGAAPFYWAAFVSVGDDAPVAEPNYYLQTIIILLCVGAIGWFWYKWKG
jgi:CHAT domain-containing protein